MAMHPGKRNTCSPGALLPYFFLPETDHGAVFRIGESVSSGADKGNDYKCQGAYIKYSPIEEGIRRDAIRMCTDWSVLGKAGEKGATRVCDSKR